MMKVVKRVAVAILVQVLFGFQTHSQGLPEALPEEVGMSGERLDRISPVMQDYIEKQVFPGMVTLVAREGKVVHLGTYGKMRSDMAMKPDAIFQIASMTKPITSVAVMMLFEEGHFLLDDSVSKYLPQFNNQMVFAGLDAGELVLEKPHRPVNIKDLLTHTSGLSYGMFSQTPVDSMMRRSGMWYGDLEEMADALGPIPLLFQPGDHWHYSLATDVLGYLVEVVSGQSFDRFLQERIFGPLGMDDTDFFVPERKLDRVMPVFSPNDQGKLEARSLSSIPNETPEFLSGGGGLYSTISDYARFAQMILNGGELDGVRLLSYKSVDYMLTNQLTEKQIHGGSLRPGVGFGLGFSVLEDLPLSANIGSEGAAGWSGINNTFFTVDPQEDLLFILMTQSSPYNIDRIRDQVSTLVYQSLME
jgi:CubicO group peptidase (beta-lactamase class C family)